MRTKSKKLLGCGIISLITLAVSVVVAGLFLNLVFGTAYSNTEKDRRKLRELCNPVKNIPLVIDAHHAKHGSYPNNITNLDPSLPNAKNTAHTLKKAGFTYSSDGTSYSIHKKLNWDGSIIYHSRSVWKYTIHGDTEWPIY